MWLQQADFPFEAPGRRYAFLIEQTRDWLIGVIVTISIFYALNFLITFNASLKVSSDCQPTADCQGKISLLLHFQFVSVESEGLVPHMSSE